MKINKWNFIKLKIFCIAKETNKPKQNKTLPNGRIYSQMISDQRLASKIYKELTHKQKNKHLDQKMGRKPEEIFLQRRHRDGQETDEKMLNITNHQGNGNTNHEILPHASQNGYY